MNRVVAFVTATLGAALLLMTGAVVVQPAGVGNLFGVTYLLGAALFLLAGMCGGFNALTTRRP